MLKDLEKELAELAALGRVPNAKTVLARENGFITIGNKRLVDFTNWDILTLNENPKFKRAAQSEIERYGIGTSAPRLSSGTTHIHRSAEKRIANFVGTEDALLFSSKNQAVLTLLSALLSESDVVLVDELCQSPAVDAAHLVNTPVLTFAPGDLGSFRKALENTKNSRRKLVYVESISPLTGRKNDLGELATIAIQNDSHLIVDESFALGALGLRGAGQTEEPNLKGQTFAAIGDLSFGLAAYGAFVAGPTLVVDYLRSRSKTIQSEAALPSSIAAAIETSIDTAELSTGTRERLSSLGHKLHLGLQELGVLTEFDDSVPFTCLKLKNSNIANELAAVLFRKGFLVEVIPAPFPRSQAAIVRIIINAAHSESSIDALLATLAEIWPKLNKS